MKRKYIVEHMVFGYWMHFGQYDTMAEAEAAAAKSPGKARIGVRT